MEGSPLKVVLPVDTPPAKEALYKENTEVKTRVDEWLTSAQNKEEVENKPHKSDRPHLKNRMWRPFSSSLLHSSIELFNINKKIIIQY